VSIVDTQRRATSGMKEGGVEAALTTTSGAFEGMRLPSFFPGDYAMGMAKILRVVLVAGARDSPNV